jgi:pilus assembly protein CpaB
MKKQFIAIGVAAVLALLGVAALISYAHNADDRAAAGAKLVSVLRVTEEIPAKTPAADLDGKVETTKIPKSAVVPGALSSTDGLTGLVSTSVLVPGDQLTDAKFAGLDKLKGDAAVPKGMQMLAVPLDGARIVGGALAAGDKAGVFISYNGKTANPINNLLVLKVSAPAAGSTTPATGTIITFAVKTLDAEKIVHGMEFGKVWLSKQDADTDTSGGKTISQQDVTP